MSLTTPSKINEVNSLRLHLLAPDLIVVFKASVIPTKIDHIKC